MWEDWRCKSSWSVGLTSLWGSLSVLSWFFIAESTVLASPINLLHHKCMPNIPYPPQWTLPNPYKTITLARNRPINIFPKVKNHRVSRQNWKEIGKYRSLSSNRIIHRGFSLSYSTRNKALREGSEPQNKQVLYIIKTTFAGARENSWLYLWGIEEGDRGKREANSISRDRNQRGTSSEK